MRGWVEEIGRDVGAVRPDLITWEWAVKKRTGQIRIDYTQNIINKTLAAAYSARARTGGSGIDADYLGRASITPN